LQPVVTAILALIVLSQPLRWGYVGAFAIFYGVWLVAKGRDLNATSGKMKYDDSAPTNAKEEEYSSISSGGKEVRV
jgi:drug/metabolite transporter (DMT)-like permease